MSAGEHLVTQVAWGSRKQKGNAVIPIPTVRQSGWLWLAIHNTTMSYEEKRVALHTLDHLIELHQPDTQKAFSIFCAQYPIKHVFGA